MARVLLVEDDPPQRDVRALILRQAGHTVTTAATYEEAIERCPDCDVIVLDLIPRSAELVSELPKEARVIVLSGREVKPGSIRADCILQKPCPSRALLNAITRLCILLLLISSAFAHSFEITKPSEVLAELDMRAPGTDWSNPANPAVLATIELDGRRQQNVMLYAGGERFTYKLFLGRLGAGTHTLVTPTTGVELLAARFREVDSEILAHAPILFARPNTIGKFTDIPLITYCELFHAGGFDILQYSVIWSNEDGGTPTRALMARWGRTTDIEWVYKVFLTVNGHKIDHATIQAAEHKEIEFRGHREGMHPLLLTATDNNNMAYDGTSAVRYQIPPVLTDLSQHSREQLMDEHPFSYRVMAKELLREGKLRPYAEVQSENVSDPRNYLYIEARVRNQDSALGFLVRLQGSPRWFSSDLGHPDYAIKRDGWIRTTVELPPGTKAGQIAGIGAQCLTIEKKLAGACELLAVSKCFLLDSIYAPATHIWSTSVPQIIRSGEMWTSTLK